ncbi:MAG: hypothetical protein COB41_06105 [Proteobacteria bacterium]|nr:MAG: hypothetical protein COB41_06105 [Pseudomonadota bacterium]
MKKNILLLSILSLIGACSTLPIEREHAEPKSENSKQAMDHENDFFVARKGISDGYEFIFHVMPAPEGEGFSRVDYHLMVSIEKNGKPLDNLNVYSEVKHPDGTAQPKAKMMRMGHWYMTVYNLSHEQGRHWMTVSFEADGRVYSSGVYYPERTHP